MDIVKNIKENLLRERGLAGYSQRYVALKLCVTNKTISNWECGRRLPSIIELYQLAELYGVTIDDLLKEAE